MMFVFTELCGMLTDLIGRCQPIANELHRADLGTVPHTEYTSRQVHLRFDASDFR